MSDSQHTPGPWRWEVNEKGKVVELCGGKPQYDLTVMDFERWGMGSAIPRFRDPSDHGLLTRCLKWARKVIGREHHSDWFKSLDHPDARLIAAAPDLLAALDDVMLWIKNWSPMFTEENEWAATAALVEKAKAKVEGRAA